ncbi:MAG: hypothetical protein NTW04_00355, partial [Elusimicrobia bacterium]|nr:hypothetical protein [Elusimicrobiota bacterium]
MNIKFGEFIELKKAFCGEVASLKKNPLAPLLVVAPSRRLAESLELALARRLGAYANISFHTFFSLASAIVSEEGDAPSQAAPAFYEYLLKSVIAENSAGIFASCESRGFAKSLAATIRDLSDACIDLPVIFSHIEEGAFGPAEDSSRAAWLFSIYAQYTEKLKKLPFESRLDFIRRAARMADTSAYLNRFERIIYYGFY